MNKEKEVATIFDFLRFCKSHEYCNYCPFYDSLHRLINKDGDDYCIVKRKNNNPEKINETIMEWVKEHPPITRKSKLKAIFPNVKDNMDICPMIVENFDEKYCEGRKCATCQKEYWYSEIVEDKLDVKK